MHGWNEAPDREYTKNKEKEQVPAIGRRGRKGVRKKRLKSS